ncbi:Plastin-3 [Hondaea fermentalgiana]|uniref:Plastin-3 n=1 Tax=Hondaea fermentalgiana TaxID=2315210 RepID=A0A2R5GQE0_9STRA|nr:Plastin-3 [Hondaea fermentalgiana]|eukprot:GBG30094.1 Plastin-3 [Hondaea fermentalgiana]
MLRPGRPPGKKPLRLALRSPRQKQQQQQQPHQDGGFSAAAVAEVGSLPRFLCEVLVDETCDETAGDEVLRNLTAQAKAAAAAAASAPAASEEPAASSRCHEEKQNAQVPPQSEGIDELELWREILKKATTSSAPDQLGPGNCFQAASAFAVLGALSQSTFQLGGELGRSMLQDLVRAVFRKDLAHRVLGLCLPDEKSHENVFNAIQTIAKEATQDNFYALATERLLHKRNLLRSEIERWNSLEASMQKELLKKQMLMEKTAKQWQKSLLTSMFRNWKSVTESRKRQRELLNACFARVSKSKAKQIFQAWKRVAAETKRARALHEIREIDARYERLQTSKRELDTEIKRAADDVSEWNDRLNDLHSEMAELRARIEEIREDGEPQVLRHSNAKRVATAWFELCNAIIFQEIGAFEANLDEMDEDNFVDLELLVTDATELDSLSEIALDDLLLRWLRFHVPDERIENFSSDLADGVVLWKLMKVIRPTGIDLEAIEVRHNKDAERALISALRSLPELSAIQSEAVRSGASDILYCIVSFLFCKFPTLSRPQAVWHESRQILKDAALEQETLDDYVSRNSVIDLQHETTWNGLVKRTEETRRKVRWCLREREQKSGLWNTIHKRVQSVAWVLLLERLRGGKVDVPDHKEERILAEFTVVDGYATSKREDEAVGSILQSNFGLLRTMFHYYCTLTTTNRAPRAMQSMGALALLAMCRDLGFTESLEFEVMLSLLREQQPDEPSPAMHPREFIRFILCAANIRLRKAVWHDTSVVTTLTEAQDALVLHFAVIVSKCEEDLEQVDAFTHVPLSVAVEHLRACLPAEMISALEKDIIPTLELEDTSQVHYGEFCELVVALAAQASPNPLIPFPTRLCTMLEIFRSHEASSRQEEGIAHACDRLKASLL